MPLLLTILASVAIFGGFFVIACMLAGARCDAANAKAWAEFKPRPLRAHEIGEPSHGAGDRL